MTTDTIAALLQPFLDRTLPEVSLHQISMYIDLLLHWNTRINLTAIRDPKQIVTRHFGESFFLARHLFPVETQPSSPVQPSAGVDDRLHVLDIGSGAGFPGLPLKLWAPQITLTLVESNHKKAAFLREVVRTLTLTDVNVTTARADTLVAGAQGTPETKASAAARPHFPADVVTLRAVERFETIVPIASSLVSPTGRLALLIGSSQFSTLTTLAPTFHALPQVPVPQSQARIVAILVRLEKVGR